MGNESKLVVFIIFYEPLLRGIFSSVGEIFSPPCRRGYRRIISTFATHHDTSSCPTHPPKSM